MDRGRGSKGLGPWDDTADLIVVGAGSAGTVVARRLADAGARVLLLEAGPPAEHPDIADPGGVFRLWHTDLDWDYRTDPQPELGGRRLHWPRGRVLGGSSALNGMIYVRGAPADYDGWAGGGNPGWSYADVLPLFRRSEDFDGGASRYHGVGGPLAVRSRYHPHPVNAAVVEAAVEAGIAFNPDCNGERPDGVGFCQLTLRGKARHSTADAFLHPFPAGLTVRTGARASRLLVQGGRCTGVEYVVGGQVRQARADLEVIVSAGTVESPALLMRSGIGSAGALRRLGLDVHADLPGVGGNLHDHFLVPVIVAAARPVPPAVPGLQVMHSQLFWRSRAGLAAPDVQPLFFHVPLYGATMSGPPDAFTLMAGVVRPASRGRLTVTSADPAVPPRIDPAYLAEPADVDTAVAAVELCREIARQPALDGWRGTEWYPGPEVRTRAELRGYVAGSLVTYHHQVGTCRMGVDAHAVVDPRLRVRGVAGLRVADASVMPTVPSGNTNAPTIMIGERCADLVLAEHRIAQVLHSADVSRQGSSMIAIDSPQGMIT